MNLQDTKLHSLVIFRSFLKDPVVQKLDALLKADPQDETAFVDAYSDFASALFEKTDNWSDYILNFIMEDENLYMMRCCTKEGPSERLQFLLEQELKTLQSLSAWTGADLRVASAYKGFLPAWDVTTYDLKALYQDRIDHIAETGYGIFSKYHMFTVKDGQIIPVRHPDPQRIEELSGYERERSRVIANTMALLEGRPANNVLLYGDAGTGKSSTVKAIANEYYPKGLRLIEVKKNQLYQIPALVEALGSNPCRFILFIDDLSFSQNDNDFAALKAILEGSVNGRTRNLVVYATSNRRHLIKETMSDRTGDDVHRSDTLQELMSLSARFGLQITFQRPDKPLYAQIVCDLAKQYGLDMPEEELIERAEAHAIRAGGRSPRTAKQFVEMLKAQV